MMLAAGEVLQDFVGHWRLLVITTRVEFQKRYAGSVAGLAWVVLNPILFLGVYLFLYLVVFKVRFPEMSELGFATYVFSGLVPFMALMEVSSSSVMAVKANIHLVKNLVFPIALVPLRVVLTVLVTELVGLAMVLVLAALDGQLSWNILLLPIVILVQMLLLTGLAFILSALGTMLPDVGYFLNAFLMFLLFITPIGFKPEMVPRGLGPIVSGNPFYYMVDAFRTSLLARHGVAPIRLVVFAAIALLVFALGSAFFKRFRTHVVDYE